MLGLDICADIMVGDEMRRGISGGQKKRVTTGYNILFYLIPNQQSELFFFLKNNLNLLNI